MTNMTIIVLTLVVFALLLLTGMAVQKQYLSFNAPLGTLLHLKYG